METSDEKTKLMTNNTSGINTKIKMNGQKLETVTSFKYLGSVVSDEGSKPEILSRIAQKTAAFISIIINPLTVIGAPQMILQPVFSIFPCSPLPSGTCRTPGLSIP